MGAEEYKEVYLTLGCLASFHPFLLPLGCLVPVMDMNIELCLENTQGLDAGTIPSQSQILNYTLFHNLRFFSLTLSLISFQMIKESF